MTNLLMMKNLRMMTQKQTFKQPRKAFIGVAALCSMVLGSSAHALDIYVSPDGSDSNSGRAGQPLASLAGAQDKVRSVAGKEAVTVHVADGIYYLPDTLIFTPEDSGSAKHPV
ncbi:MAG: hypothetical protein NWR36_08595, partial [Opitutales bacterium]|nr:hypothetical protein [Opitutales bacterium]